MNGIISQVTHTAKCFSAAGADVAQGLKFLSPGDAGIPRTPAPKAAAALPAVHPSAQKWPRLSRTSAHLAQYLPSNN